MNTIPSKGTSARARHVSQLSSLFSFRLTFFLAISAYSGHILAQEDAPDVVTSAARTAQAVTDAQNSTTVITRTDIESASTPDVVSLLRQQVGITIRQNGTSGSVTSIGIRGGEPQHTLVLLDGMPLSSLSAGTAAIEQIPLALIDRIEVVRGNVSALYGSQATGGLIQIFTRQAQSGSKADVRLAIGDKGQRQASVQMTTGNEKVQLAAGIAHTYENAISAQNSATANPDKDDYRNNSGNISVRFTPNETNEFGVRFFETQGRKAYDKLYGANSEQYNKTKVQQISAYSNNQLTERWSSQFKVAQMLDRADDYDSQPYSGSGHSLFQTKTQDIFWQNQLTTDYGTGIAGLSHTTQKLKVDTVDYDQTKRTTKSAWLGYNLDKNRHHLQINGRFDDVSDVGNYTTGAINYGFDLNPKWRVFGGYSNGFSAPNFNAMYYPSSCSSYSWAGQTYSYCSRGNPNLKAESSVYGQVGLQFAEQNFGGRLTYFDTRYRNKIAFRETVSGNDTVGTSVNIDRARAQGVELHGWYNQNGWNVDAGVTYQEVRNRADQSLLIRQPRILANLSVSKAWKQWQAQADWVVQGRMKDSEYAVRQRVAGFGVLNTSLFYQRRADLRFGLTVGNVFDRKYEPLAGYNAMPRNVLFSVNYKPQW